MEFQMSATIEHITLTAPDISCEHCTNAIQNAVGALAGVQQVRADIATKQVDIDFDPNRVSLDKIEAVMDDEGYPVAK
jgi:copper chaperone